MMPWLRRILRAWLLDAPEPKAPEPTILLLNGMPVEATAERLMEIARWNELMIRTPAYRRPANESGWVQ